MDNTIILYLIKASISIAIFYGVYMLCLRADTFLRLRRFYFLFAIIFSLIFPTFNIEIPIKDQAPAQIPTFWLSDFYITPEIQEQTQSSPVNIQNIILTGICIISAFCVIKFIIQLLSIIKLRSGCESEKIQKYRIVKMKTNQLSPFSFFNWIFVNTEDSDTHRLKEIIAHEQAHVRQYHSIDNLTAELLCAFFWWNPFAWLIKKEIKINLEYLADQEVLNRGYNLKEYQYILLQVSNKNTGFSLINNFNISQLKKRITMMNKKKSSIAASLKYLLIVPIGAILLLGNAVQASPDLIKAATDELFDRPQNQVDQLPSFPGGIDEMNKFIRDNLRYPVTAQEAGTQGRILVSFIVKSTGEISNISVIEKADPALDKEAVRVIKSMPKWIPAKLNGNNVDASYAIPIIFKLSGSQKFIIGDPDKNTIVVVGYGSEITVSEVKKGDPKDTKKPFITVEQMPTFPGGEAEMQKFVRENLKYPVTAQKAGIQGRVTLRFIVGDDGTITNVTVIRGIDPDCDAEAVRVVSGMPKWIPGKQNGIAVPVYFNLPIQFRLKDDTAISKPSVK
ncbi:TonB family protein [Dysgonomonas reticulitermitis]